MANSDGDHIPVSVEDKSPTKESKEGAGELKAKLHNSTGDHSKMGENHRVDSKSQNGVANHITSKSHHSSDKSKESSHRHKDHKSSDSRHHHSSSSSKSKDHHHSSSNHKDGSSHKSKESSSKHHSSSKHNSSSSHSSDKSKHHHSSSSKHSSSSGHSLDKHREKDGHSSDKQRTKDGSSSSDKHREKDVHISSDKHREKDGHSSDKHRDKNGHRSDKHREKGGHSSSSGVKHREHSKGKEGSSRESLKDKEHSTSKKEHKNEVSIKKESSDFVTVKKEVASKDRSTNDLHSPKHMKSEDEDFASPKKLIVSPTKVKSEPESDDDVPLSSRMHDVSNVKRPFDSEDDEPLTSRAQKVKKIKKEDPKKEDPKKAKKRKADESDDEAFTTKKKKKVKGAKVKTEATPTKKGKKKEAEPAQEAWKWWEEERKDDGTKWTFLEHKGPVFAPDYEPLPGDVKFKYDGKEVKLSIETEEVAGFFAKMLEHDYTTREVFKKNFFKDWRKVMKKEEKEIITDINKCNFKHMHAYFTQLSEQRKNRTKEEKLELKKTNEDLQAEYGYCNMDSHKEKIGNFRIEPPGLFRGRGDHPKQGMLKTRTVARDVTINCHKDAVIPEPPKGQKWKKVQHDNTVSWLACWTENVQGQNKYIMLNPASRLKGEKDWNKYEVARKLAKYVDKIRAQYREDWKSKEMRIRQRAVALYFIDKLALRAGNEKDEGESADTVGCCSLRVEHLALHENLDGKEFVVEFDFLGKDSIRYQNSVPVERRVYKNLELFTDNKQPGDDIFDRLNTAILNKHLHDLMEGLTAKVFRTYNASKTLQDQLDLLTNEDDNIPAKILSYNRANRAVAVLCNHQRAVPKNFSKQMENMQVKIDAKKDAIKDAKRAVKDAKSTLKAQKTETAKMLHEKRKKILARLEEQLTKLEVSATDKDENKDIALGTSKLNYLDPRISVAWCKKWEVPLEKIYNKTQREKFRWAIDMTTSDFTF